MQKKPPVSAKPFRTGIIAGALWMFAASLGFTALIGLIRFAGSDIHPFEVAFFRSFFGLVWMLPWLVKVGWVGLRTKRKWLYVGRAAVGIVSMLSWFWAINRMPLTEGVALSFTAPLFATIFAVFMLGEKVRARRWIAVVVGFIGVIVVLRPGSGEIGWPAAAMLFSAITQAVSSMSIKALTRDEPPARIVAYMVIFMTPLSLPPALFVWSWPSPLTWGILIAIGLIATVSHLCMTRAFRAADASAVMPFDYSRIVLVSIMGYLWFDEKTDLWTWVGAAIIIGSSLYIVYREAQVARATRKSARPATAAAQEPDR